MKFIYQLCGIGLILLGVYFLGRNIIFTTNSYPYFWRGISADISILSLTVGLLAIFILPPVSKIYGWILIIFGIICIFFASTAILVPVTLWQFFVSVAGMMAGFKLLTDRNLGG